MSPLPEGTFSALILEVPPTKGDGGRQLFGKSFSDEPSMIFSAGTLEAHKEKTVSETPTESLSVHKSPPKPKPSERVSSETPAERLSETPQTPQIINLVDYVTKVKFESQILKRDQEIVSLKERLLLTEV